MYGSDMSFTTPAAPTDTVTITKANYNWKKQELTVEATSSEAGSVTLEVFIDGDVVSAGTLVYNSKKNKYTGKISSVAYKPSEVMVTSTGGGSDTDSGSDIGGKGG